MTRLPDFRLETFFSRWEFTARYHLTASDAQTLIDGRAARELADGDDREAWETLSLGYTETFGDPALRAAIAGMYEHAEADDVICFAGAEEAPLPGDAGAARAGDHALVVDAELPGGRDRAAVAVRGRRGFALDSERRLARWTSTRVAAAIRPNTRVVSVNFPNNPTGAVIDAADFRRLAAAVRRARHPPVQRRGVPRPRARPGAHAAARRRRVRARPCR